MPTTVKTRAVQIERSTKAGALVAELAVERLGHDRARRGAGSVIFSRKAASGRQPNAEDVKEVSAVTRRPAIRLA